MLSLLKTNKSVTVAELSKKFFIGETTIRKDLQKLEKMGQVKRTYGGAVLMEGNDAELPFAIRQMEQKNSKQIIGNIASGLVKSGDIIIMDSSSTAFNMIPFLIDKSNITVITNGVKTAGEVNEKLQAKVYCTGGIMKENVPSLAGDHAIQFMKNLYADVMFFSCKAISIEQGITDSYEDEAVLLSTMIERCKKIVLLCDSTKFDRINFRRICNFDKIHCLITDKNPSPRWIEFLSEKGVQLMYG